MKIDVEMVLLEKSVLVQLIKNCTRRISECKERYEGEFLTEEIDKLRGLDLLTEHNITTFVTSEVKDDS